MVNPTAPTITSVRELPRQFDKAGCVYTWIFSIAGAVAFGWWQSNVAAAIFALILLVLVFQLSTAAYEITDLMRLGLQNRECQTSADEANARNFAVSQIAATLIGSRLANPGYGEGFDSVGPTAQNAHADVRQSVERKLYVKAASDLLDEVSRQLENSQD